ncbi:hypothetical protein [Ruegeria aquimaris]|uniref:hypothetical protein n=1 Tax=Ruegeria aquimaris TaxID=2984333 RepID=UPI0021E6DEB8|nr:hypothetical protein [Ruegeria sp. XHP0148]
MSLFVTAFAYYLIGVPGARYGLFFTDLLVSYLFPISPYLVPSIIAYRALSRKRTTRFPLFCSFVMYVIALFNYGSLLTVSHLDWGIIFVPITTAALQWLSLIPTVLAYLIWLDYGVKWLERWNSRKAR